MKTLASEMRLLLDVITAPRAAVRALGEHAPVGGVLVLLGALQAIVVAIQAWLVQPAVLGDPLLVDSALEMESVLGRYWMARSVAIALGPAGSFLRGAALATLLQSGAALCGVALRWRVLLSLALHLDVVFWLESAYVTLLLWLCRPTEIEELASLRLRAGLDLVWHPRSERLAALLEAANLFTVWWAALLALALAAWMHGRRRMAVSAAASLWLSLVLLRMVTTSR